MSSRNEEPTSSGVTDPITTPLDTAPLRRHARPSFGDPKGVQVELDGKKNKHGVTVYAPATLKPNKHRQSRSLPPHIDPPDILPLYLSVKPTEFVINPEKGTEITIRSLSAFDHDLIVTCNSYLYELKGAKAQYGMLSQVFRVLKQYEMVSLTIGLTEKKNMCPSESMTLDPHTPDGYLEIYHYRCHTSKKTDSDADWSIEGKDQLVHAQVHVRENFGHWKDVLRTEFETEEVKKRRADFQEKRNLLEQRTPPEILEKSRHKRSIKNGLKGKHMMIDEPYGPAITDSEMERKAKESEENKKPSTIATRKCRTVTPERMMELEMPERVKEPKTKKSGFKKLFFWRKKKRTL